MRVRYVGPFCMRTGYGQACHDYLAALALAGVDLSIQPIHDGDSDNLDPRYGSLLGLVGRNFEPTHVIVHTIPRYANEFVKDDLAPSPGVKKVCVTTWETDKFPKEDAERLDEFFDLVIVPAWFCRQSMVEAGLPPGKVAVIPHTFDPCFWITHGAGQRRRSGKNPYTFYSILSWTDRKNPIGLLKAYLSEFRTSNDVLLRIVTPVVNEDDITTLARCMGIEDLPNVEFLGRWDKDGKGRLSETDLRQLHEDSDCYVSASRGEGWGLGAFEAACVGNPVIVTEFSGFLDYLNHYKNKQYVECFPTPAVTPEVKVGKIINIGGVRIAAIAPGAPTGITGDQNWAEPNLAQLKHFMRKAYEDGSKSFADQGKFVELFGYEAVGKHFKFVLESI